MVTWEETAHDCPDCGSCLLAKMEALEHGANVDFKCQRCDTRFEGYLEVDEHEEGWAYILEGRA